MSLNSSQVVLLHSLLLLYSFFQLPFEVYILACLVNIGVTSTGWGRQRARSLSCLSPKLTGYVGVFKSCNGSSDNPHLAGWGCTIWETWQALIDERVRNDPEGSPTLWDHISSHKQPDLATLTQTTLEECVCVCVIRGNQITRGLLVMFLYTLCMTYVTTLDTNRDKVISDLCREVFFSFAQLQRVRAQGQIQINNPARVRNLDSDSCSWTLQ